MSTTVCGVFLLDNNEDIGFLRKGRPFLPFCGSEAATGDGSDVTRGPVGRFAGPPGARRSVGVENHEDLGCLVGAAGRASVLMGGGAGFALESWFSGRGAVMARAGPARCGSWAAWYFRKATPPMKPCLFPSS